MAVVPARFRAFEQEPPPMTASAASQAAGARPSTLDPDAPARLRPSDVRALRDAVSGAVLVDGDPGYDAARGLHNTHFGRRPPPPPPPPPRAGAPPRSFARPTPSTSPERSRPPASSASSSPSRAAATASP